MAEERPARSLTTASGSAQTSAELPLEGESLRTLERLHEAQRIGQVGDHGARPRRRALVLHRPDGVKVHVQASAVARIDDQGCVVELAGTMQDV